MGLATLLLAIFLQVEELSPRLEEVTSDTLVVLDLDDTLICYPSHLGSTPWFEEAYASWELEAFHEMAGRLARELPVVPVEPNLPAVFASLEAPTLILTGRETTHPAVPNWPQRTQEQLQEAGYLPMEIHMGGRAGKASLFAQLMKEHRPSRLIIVDDRRSDLEALAREADRLGIECEAWWYRARSRLPYDAAIATTEWQTLQLAGVDGVEE